MRTSLFLFCLIPVLALGQAITANQQKALNNYVEYANQSAEEVTAVVKSIINYYPALRQKNPTGNTHYAGPFQIQDYYLNKAFEESKFLGTLAIPVTEKLKALRAVAEKIDNNCKALDTYHKLEDYKQDHFVKAKSLIAELQQLLVTYAAQQSAFADELEATYKKLNKYKETDPYAKTAFLMQQQIRKERAFMNTWTFNLQEVVHTGWPVDKLEQSISDTDQQLKILAAYKPALKYPAASSIGSFTEALAYILEIKRNGLDDYTFDAKNSDEHSNEVYLNLINYFNGVLVPSYNSFVDFATADGYLGLKAIKYVPAFEIREKKLSIEISVVPFHDIVQAPLTVTTQKTALPKNTFSSLNGFIDLINESLRQVDYLQLTIRNINSSAAYYRNLTSYQGKGGLTHDYKNYVIPLSRYQKTITESNANIPIYAKYLNDQAEVLLSILKELDMLNASLKTEVSERRYEKDNLKRVYEIINRNKTLFEIFDDKKEQLYRDVRRIYDAYPIANASSSWAISGKALQTLTDLDHDELFKAKAFYKGDKSITIETTKIDEVLRNVISDEYTNMKGIEKIGRNNGNCPYTPYEDLPVYSKRLSEKLNSLKLPVRSSAEHPYHEMIYQYNEIVDNLNKFSELSKDVLLLKIVKQPEGFLIKDDDNNEQPKQPQKTDDPQPVAHASTPIVKPVKKENAAVRKANTRATVVHDTVYIEKRDTVYMGVAGEDLHSMEGYATNNLILLLDVSGSMNAPEKLPLLKKSVLDLLTMMRPEDKVSILIYAAKAKVLLSPTSFKDEEKIKKVIEKLKTQGKTDGNAGLKLAYSVADDSYIRGGNNRILLATDGEFTISPDVMDRVANFSKQDIFITVFDFGKRGGSSVNLQKLASIGKGNYDYINKENVELKLIQEVKAKRK